MKHLLLSTPVFLALFNVTSVKSQTLTLQPDGTAGKDAYINSNAPTVNGGATQDNCALAWTNSGNQTIVRSLLEFDLSSIPSNSVVSNATLTLYHNPLSVNTSAQHQSLSGSNEGVIQRVMAAWDENTVVWNNQPATSSVNQVTIPQSTSATQDYSLDVTAMVQDMITNPSTNYGFMIKIVTESPYRSLIFASSDNSDATNHPKLVINYSTAGVDELTTNKKELVKIVDLMGRETNFKENTPLIYIYSDGSTERIIKISE